MPITSAKIDVEKAVSGDWIDFPEYANSDGSIPGFLLARSSGANKRYAKALNAAIKPVRRAIDANTLSDEKSDEIILNVFLKTVLLDWRHIQLADDGKEFVYNYENAKSLLSDPAYEVLYSALQAKANQIGAAIDEGKETVAGN